MRALTESESMLKNKTLWFSISFIGGFQLIMDVDTIHVIIIFFDDGRTQRFQFFDFFFLVALYWHWLTWWIHVIRQQHHDLWILSSKFDKFIFIDEKIAVFTIESFLAFKQRNMNQLYYFLLFLIFSSFLLSLFYFT